VAVKANADATERMIRDPAKNYGYAREDLVSDRIAMDGVDPGRMHDADEQVMAELKGLGTLQPREKDYFRKDGGRVPVLVTRALFEWKPDKSVAFVIDLNRPQAGGIDQLTPK
jgi:hypothetical protein